MFEIKKEVSLKDFCTFRIGGSAKFLVVAKNNTQLIEVCLYCKTHNIKYKVIGLGANLLFDDLGFNGMIIVNKTNKILFRNVRGSFDCAQDDSEGCLHTADCAQDDSECAQDEKLSYRSKRGTSASSVSSRFTPLTSFGRNDCSKCAFYNRLNKCVQTSPLSNFSAFPSKHSFCGSPNILCHSEWSTSGIEESPNHRDKHYVYVDSGVNVTSLIMKCCLRSLCGFERLAGIPSTVGGAVVNSLGAFETNFSDFVEYVECYHKNDLTKKIRLNHEKCKFGYRTSLFKNGDYIITRIKLRLFEDDKTLIQQRIKEAVEKKKSTQPLDYPSAGSIFKRGNIIPAKVIDELGLKGTKIGGAEISTKHAGFIVNSYSATSKNVKELISLIQKKVKTTHNEDLEPEIEFVEY